MYQILAVDDDINLSKSLKFSLSEVKDLKVDFFGIDIEKIDKNDFKNTIAKRFIEYSKKVNIAQNYDLLLIDYNMPNYNAKETIQKCSNLPPVIVMSADTAQMQESITNLLITRKAKRYIFKNSEVFGLELEILANDIIAEKNNEKSLNILEELLVDDSIDSFETFAEKLSSQFMQSFPNTLMVIREYNQADNSLVQVHKVIGVNIESKITKDSANEVFYAIDMDDGYYFNNEFKLDSKWKDIIKLHGGNIVRYLTIRLGSKERVLGVVNITKPITSAPFNKQDVASFKRLLDIATTKLKLTTKSKDDLELFDSLSKASIADSEDELIELYIKTIHKIFNDNDNKRNKTTIKLRDLKEDKLIYCYGICPPKKEHFEPYISENTVSSYVYLYNTPVLINDTQNEDSLEKSWIEFKEKLPDYHKNNIEKFEYKNPQIGIDMRSELCLPIANKNSVLGVLNLESSLPYYYNYEQLKLLEKLNTIIGNIIFSIRIKDLTTNLMDAFNLLEENRVYDKIKNSLQKHLGYFAMMLFKYEDRKLHLNSKAIYIGDKKISSLKIKESFDKREDKSYIDWAKEVFLSKGYNGIYIPNLNSSIYFSIKNKIPETKREESNFIPFHKTKYKVKSIYFQAIYSNSNDLLYIVMLEYKNINPLRMMEIELINSSAGILSTILYNNSTYQQRDRVSEFISQSIRAHFSNLRHTIINRIKSMKGSLTKEQNDVFEYIKKITYGFDNAMVNSDIKSIYFNIIDELGLTKSNINCDFRGINIDIKESKKSLIYLFLYHLILNAKEHLEELNIDKKEIITEVLKDGDTIEIRVYDSGVLPKEEEKIFNRGYSTKNKNSGVGLYYLKDFIESVGAEIAFVNSPKYFRFNMNKNELLKG